MARGILVVDDEPQLHRFLRPALEAAGYQVERAETAAEGLRLAANAQPGGGAARSWPAGSGWA